jgi:hypothetical protein
LVSPDVQEERRNEHKTGDAVHLCHSGGKTVFFGFSLKGMVGKVSRMDLLPCPLYRRPLEPIRDLTAKNTTLTPNRNRYQRRDRFQLGFISLIGYSATLSDAMKQIA